MNILLIAAVCLVCLVAAAYGLYRRRLALTHIEYLGQSFKLPRVYPSYESYRNDPSNLGPENLRRIQLLVQSHSSAGPFADAEAFGRQMFELKVPGYGMASLTVESSEPKPLLLAFEIPGTQKWRYLFAAGPAGAVRILDDFVHEAPRIAQAQLQGSAIRYLGADGSLIRESAL